jgi:Protein of unknown function (DUF3800)
MDKEFTYLLKNPNLRQQLLGDIYSLISQIDVVLISCIIDKSNYFNKYIDDDAKYISFKFLIERCEGYIDSLCKNRDNDYREFGLIIMDNSTAEEDTRTYSKYIRISGTDQQQITRIIEEPLFTPSHWRTFTQLADAVAYCSTHYLSSDPLFTTHFLIIQDKFYKNKYGSIEGYGWKLFPP